MSHPNLEPLFTGRLSTPEVEALWGHLKGCADCQRVYERFAAAEQALGSGSLSPFAQDRVALRLWSHTPPSRARGPWVVFAALAATATLGIAIFPQPPPMQARGEHATLSAGTTLRVLRIRNQDGQPAVEDTTSGAVGIRAGDRLQLLYTNLDGATQIRVTVLLEGQPIHSMESPLVIGAQDRTLGEPLPVTESWLSGKLEVVAVFGRAPLPEAPWTDPARDGEQRVRRVVVAKEAP